MTPKNPLQWGGRFAVSPDEELLAFGSSLADDLVLAQFDVECSSAHVTALEAGRIITEAVARDLRAALSTVSAEIEAGTFAAFAVQSGAEDVHGAIDARVREVAASGSGDWLHAGRSRNDQVATTLLLYTRDRAARGTAIARAVCTHLLERARAELKAETVVAGVTHWQPAQPMLLAFWLTAAAEMMLRAAARFSQVRQAAAQRSPLGSGAVTGSTLPLDAAAASAQLGFAAPARNAMDAIGTRDAALDLLHAVTRMLADCARICNEIIIWSTPAFGYVRLGDAASTGSSLMPQKRNPDPFELVRAHAASVNGRYGAALASLASTGLSYHRDLQVTKQLILSGSETGLAAAAAFERALQHVEFRRAAMARHALEGYTIATDLADAMIRQGTPPREAHAAIGKQVSEAEKSGTAMGKASALDSVRAKCTAGSTNPQAVGASIAAIDSELSALL